jgi:hypothetical protein
MGHRGIQAVWLGLALGVLGESAAMASAQALSRTESTNQAVKEFELRQSMAAAIPLDRLPPKVGAGVRRVLEQPTLAAHGPAEVFRARSSFYCWLLDHPDLAVQMWRRLGARCVTISDRDSGRFGWADGQGTDISWQTIYRARGTQVWYAEGVATPGPVLPPVPLRAVVILRYAETSALSPLLPEGQAHGRTLMFHQAEVFVQTDSQTAALIAKLLGSSAPKMAEKCIGQLEMFFSALAWYVDRHPERAETLLSGLLPPGSAN